MPISIGSVGKGERTRIKVVAVYLGEYFCKSFHIPPPAARPKIVKIMINKIWRRKIPRTSLGVNEAATGDLSTIGAAILFEVFGFSSAITVSSNYSKMKPISDDTSLHFLYSKDQGETRSIA